MTRSYTKSILSALIFGAVASTCAASTPLVSARQVFQDPKWGQEFAYSFTPNAELEPKITAIEADFFKQIQPLIQAGDMLQAKNRLETEQVVGNPEANPAMIFTLGNFYWMMSQEAQGVAAKTMEETAIRYYKQAIEKFPNYLRAHKNLGQLYMQQDKTDLALPHLVKALTLGDNEARTYGVIGYIYFTQNKPVSSETALRNALSLDPSNKNFRVLLGQALLEQNRYAEANALFKEILQEDPNNTDIWLAQFNTFMGMDKIDEAAANLEIVRLMGKAKPEQLMLLGNIYINKGMLGLATDTFVSALEISTSDNDKESLISAASTLTSFGAYSDATRLMDAVEKGFEGKLSDRESLNILTLRSRIAIAEGEGARAANILEDILSRDAMNADALLTLGRYYSDMVETEDGELPRDRERAVLYFERAQDHPNEDVRVNSYLQHGQLMVRIKRFADAVDLIEKAQDIKKQDHVETFLAQVRQAARAQMARR